MCIRDSWNTESQYKTLYLIPSGLKHDSGYMTIAIVGKKENGSMEVCAHPDDIDWDFSALNQKFPTSGMRMDCIYPNGVIQCHGAVRYIVGEAFSSTEIKVIPLLQ